MLRTECSFCDHTNPAGSKFCNGCGGPLHLAQCPHCNALNDKTATACHKCQAPLPSGPAEALALGSSAAEATVNTGSAVQLATGTNAQRPHQSIEPTDNLLGSCSANPERHRLVNRIADALSPNAAFAFVGSHWPPVASKTLLRPRFGMRAGAVGLVALAGVGLYFYYDLTADAPQIPAARGKAMQPIQSDAGLGNRGAVTPAVAEQDKGGSQRPLAREGEQPADRNAAVVAPMRVQTGSAGTGIEEQPLQLGQCTEVVAALGLCAPPSIQRR
jgi:hypothetical protein